MTHKKCYEALDITLRDIKENNKMFGGIPLLIGGDFRQTLPIVPRQGKRVEIQACIKASYLWNNCKEMNLNININERIKNSKTKNHSMSDQEFNNWLLKLGKTNTNELILPETQCLKDKSIKAMVNEIYPNIEQNIKDEEWLSKRAILTVRNSTVDEINNYMMSKLKFLPNASDFEKNIAKDGYIASNEARDTQCPEVYTPEDLSFDLPGLPPNELKLKVGSPIILLRNFNAAEGHCNGTKYIIEELRQNSIKARAITGKAK